MTLFIIFIFGLVLRFLFFPNNIYFGFDQTRDAFAALDIIHGDLKLIGPSTSIPGLFHGVLYYYILAPFYFISKGSPELVSAILRILNATGIFLIFYLGQLLFNKKVAILVAFLFAISFEQTQFSIYMGNPSLASISVVLMYLGLALVIFKKKWFGLPLSTLGLGFSIQFQFALAYLILPFVLIIIIFRKYFSVISLKIWFLSAGLLALLLSSFILTELKFHLNSFGVLINLGQNHSKDLVKITSTYLFTILQMIKFNFSADLLNKVIIIIFLAVVFFIIATKDIYKKQFLFLSIWFLSLFVTFFISGGVADLTKDTPLYYPNIGVSSALLIFVAFLLEKIWIKNIIISISLIGIITFSNFILIKQFNPNGTISEINVQQGMLLSDEKKVLDYLYLQSSGPFTVKAVTMPFNINTTWSYLFEWYGKNKYGYLPIWNGKNALGYPGHLKVQEAQENLPKNRYVIIEPLRGVPQYLVDDYLKEENYFTKVVEEKKFGEFIIQKRTKI